MSAVNRPITNPVAMLFAGLLLAGHAPGPPGPDDLRAACPPLLEKHSVRTLPGSGFPAAEIRPSEPLPE